MRKIMERLLLLQLPQEESMVQLLPPQPLVVIKNPLAQQFQEEDFLSGRSCLIELQRCEQRELKKINRD
jgi:hypothetical protein